MSETQPIEVPSNFSQIVSRALAEIGEGKERLRVITAQLGDGSPDIELAIEEARTLVETLDKLVQKIQDDAVRDCCLRILSKVCQSKVILPNSYIVRDVVSKREWKISRFANIWTGKRGTGAVCIKVFRKHEEGKQAKIKGAFYRHIIRWKYVSHDNVLPFLGVSEILPPFCFINPLMPGGNILEYIKHHQDANRLLLLANAACGLEYLHSLNIVHTGINPGNILIDGEGVARIGDYGIAGVITDPLITGLCGSTTCRQGVVRYMAPEQVNPSKFGLRNSNAIKATDVHSFAMTSYEVLTETEPYHGTTGEGPLALRIIGDTRPPRPRDGVGVGLLPDAIWEVMESCWTPEPLSRVPIKEVHQVFLGSVATVDGPTLNGKQQPCGAPPDPQRGDAEAPSGRGFWGKIRDLVCCCYRPHSIEQ